MTKFSDDESLPDLGLTPRNRERTVSITRTAVGDVISVVHGEGNRSLGNILVQISRDDNSTKTVDVQPLSPHNMTCPVPNEKVFCIQDSNDGSWYYVGVLASDGLINHIPKADRITFVKGTDRPYTGKFFKSHPNSARAIDVIEGDVVVQGRFGQSLRMSHSNPLTKTPWNKGSRNETTPISILRTGYLPIEDMETDMSSLYLTSDQYINLPLKSDLPQSIAQTKDRYDYGQAILYSDRIVIGSRSDDIILSTAENVYFSTQNWNHDVDEVLNNLRDLITETKNIAAEVRQLATVCAQQQFTVPGIGLSALSTRVPDFTNTVSKVAQYEGTLNTIEQNIALLEQK